MANVDVKGMHHSFSVSAAVEVGVNAAILLNNIAYWAAVNAANGRNAHDGHYWTYNSVAALQELFPYLSAQKIRGALSKLEDGGYIVTGNYNKSAYDRTKWYAPTEKGCVTAGIMVPEPDEDSDDSIDENGKIDLLKSTNESARNSEPIPDQTHMSTKSNKEIDSAPAVSKDEGKGKGREPKHRHGQYGNVLLSDSELSSLREQFPDDLDSRIERLSDYIECTGKRYKSHAAVIRTWAKRDGERRQQERASDARRVPESLSDVGKRFVETPYGMVPEYEYKPEEKIAAQPPYYRRLYMKSVDRWQRQYKEALAKGGVKIVKRVE